MEYAPLKWRALVQGADLPRAKGHPAVDPPGPGVLSGSDGAGVGHRQGVRLPVAAENSSQIWRGRPRGTVSDARAAAAANSS